MRWRRKKKVSRRHAITAHFHTRWAEAISPFVPVARLDIPAQDIDQAGQAAYAEGLAFSPWRTLYENRPLGSIADARRISYPASAAVRRSLNGQPMEEPDHPR